MSDYSDLSVSSDDEIMDSGVEREGEGNDSSNADSVSHMRPAYAGSSRGSPSARLDRDEDDDARSEVRINPFGRLSDSDYEFNLTFREKMDSDRFFHYISDERRDVSSDTVDPGEDVSDSVDDPPLGVSNDWILAAFKNMKRSFLCKTHNILSFYLEALHVDPYNATVSSVTQQAKAKIFELGFLYHFMKIRHMLDVDTESGVQNNEYMQRIFASVSFGKDLVSKSIQALVVGDDERFASRGKDDIYATHFQFADRERQMKNRLLSVYLYVLEMMKQQDVRKFKNDCYTQLYVEDEQGQTHRTYAWEKLGSVEEFIHKNVTKELDWEMYEYMRSAPKNAAHLKDWLINSIEIEFPDLEYDRFVRSFSGMNGRGGGLHHMAGAFFAWGREAEWKDVAKRVNSFWEFMGYGEGSTRPIRCEAPTRNTCAIKYFEEAFDEKWADVELIYRASLSPIREGEDEHPSIVYDRERNEWSFDEPYPMGTLYGIHAIESSIPDGCDGNGLDKLMQDQELTDMTRLVLYAYFGRGLVPMKCRDDLQSFGYMLGEAGSGKSTLLNLLQALLPDDVVEVLSPQSETTFVLMTLYKAWLVVWPEAEGNPQKSGLSTSDLKTISAGEKTAVRIKHEGAISVPWPSQIWAAGNNVPDWKMNGMDILRRVVFFPWQYAITHSDTTLPDRLNRNLGAFLARNTASHLALVLLLNGRSIWGQDEKGNYLVGHQIKSCSETVKKKLDPLFAFLSDGDYYVWEDDACHTEQAFQADFHRWSKLTGFNVKNKWENSYYKPILAECGLEMKDDHLTVDENGSTIRCRCVIGIRRKNDNDTS